MKVAAPIATWTTVWQASCDGLSESASHGYVAICFAHVADQAIQLQPKQTNRSTAVGSDSDLPSTVKYSAHNTCMSEANLAVFG